MPSYISLLRGINVSGQKKIIMADLKMLYEEMGFEHVTTYIQSGNVIFHSKTNSPADLSKKIASAIETQYGFTVPITIRTRGELKKLVSSNPFIARKNMNISKLHVTFLGARPTAAHLKEMDCVNSKDDEFIMTGRDIYLYCPGGYGKTKFSNKYFEGKLNQPATTRNWKTVNTLYEIASR